MKKKSGLAAFFCTALLLFSLLCAPAAAYGQAVNTQAVDAQADGAEAQTDDAQTEAGGSGGNMSTGDFRVRVAAGLDGYYKAGAPIPLTIYLESLNEDFEGLVRVIVPASGYGSQATAYEKDIMLTAGSEKTVSMSVENGYGMGNLKLELENARGKVVLEYEIETKNQTNESALVGILSNDFTALNYFDGKRLGFGSYELSTQVVEMSADTFPTQASGLEALGYLIINSYDTSVLSEEQCEAVKGWVENGGILIIGTGSDYRQTLSGFQDGFIGGNIGSPRSGVLNLAQGLEEVPFSEEDGIVELSVEDGSPLDVVMSIPELIWTQNYGQGHVVMTAFNLGMEPVSSWGEKDEMAQQLLTYAASGYSAQRIENLNYGDSMDSWALSNALDSLHVVVSPNMKLFIILFAAFVFFAGPGLYLILKAVDKREWMWGMIPALAVVVTAGVFLFSRDMRISDPQEASVTSVYYDAEEDASSHKTYIGIRVPGASREQVTMSGGLHNLRLMDNYSYTWYSSYNDSGDIYSYKTAMRELSEGYQLTMQNQGVFESTYLTADYAAGAEETFGLETQIIKSLSGISGTVTNNTGRDLYGVSVYTDTHMVMIGELKAGESASFEEADNEFFKAGYVSFNDYSIPVTEENEEFLQQLENIWNLFESEYLYSMDAMSAYTFAWVPEWEADYVEQNKVEEVNTAMLVRRDTAVYEGYPDAQAADLFPYTVGSPNNWDTDGWMYDDEVEVSFDMGTVISEVYALIRADDSASVWGTTENVTVYAYNLQTGEYDELFTEGLIEEFPDGCPYMDEYGIIQMKFTSTLADQTDYAPEITVIGGGR